MMRSTAPHPTGPTIDRGRGRSRRTTVALALAALVASLVTLPTTSSEAAPDPLTDPAVRCGDADAFFATIDGEDSCLHHFTTAGTSTWTVPAGVTAITIVAVGGGGGGGGGSYGPNVTSDNSSSQAGGGGGGGAGAVVTSDVPVSAGDLVGIVIGAGGAGGAGSPSGEGAGNTAIPGSNGAPTEVTVPGAPTVTAGGGGGGGGGKEKVMTTSPPSQAAPLTASTQGGAGGDGREPIAAGGGGSATGSSLSPDSRLSGLGGFNGGAASSTFGELDWPTDASGSLAFGGGGGAGATCGSASFDGGTGGAAISFVSGGPGGNGRSAPSVGGDGVHGGGGGGGAGGGNTVCNSTAGNSGGKGGDGLVLIRHAALPIPAPAATTAAPSTPVLLDGATPQLAPGIGELRDAAGRAVPLVASSPRPDQVRYATDGFELTLTGAAGSSVTGGLVADADGEVECVICAALAAGQVIEAWMFSAPRLVAAWRIEDLPCQRFTIPVGAPLDGDGSVSTGTHTLQLALPTAEGMQAVNVGVTVGGKVPTAVPAGDGRGLPLSGLVAVGLLLLAGARATRRAASVARLG